MYAVNLQTEHDDEGQAILRVFTSLICGGAPTSDINDVDRIVPSALNNGQMAMQDTGAIAVSSANEPFNQGK